MEIEETQAPRRSSLAIRKLRSKTRKPQPLIRVSPSFIKKKKIEPHLNKLIKSSLKKKKKNLIKKISTQLDFTNYKKIFCNAFSKFDTGGAINPSKSNFHNFYTQVKIATENKADPNASGEEKSNDMINFMRNRKECINLKTLEKTQKIFDSTSALLDRDPSFLENFDVIKISNNVDDMKIKLDQCRKITQKYNLSKETYNHHQKDESFEQHVFSKRLKIYQSLKQDSNISLEEIPYNVNFIPHDTYNTGKSIFGQQTMEIESEQKTKVLKTADDFTDTANKVLNENLELEENLVKTMKDSELDYILKVNKKEEIEPLLKHLKMITGNLNVESLNIKDGESDESLGWRVLQGLMNQNVEGGVSTRKSLDVMGHKERFRTQKKNSDFLYYEPSLKKHTSAQEPENKRPAREKPSVYGNKRKSSETVLKLVANPESHKISVSSDKQIYYEDKSDSETHVSSVTKPQKIEPEDLKSLKMAESIIDEYREVLRHAFKNLSSRDANFARQAMMHDENIEDNTGIALNSLPQAPVLDGLFNFDLSGNYLLEYQNQQQQDWLKQQQQQKPIYNYSNQTLYNQAPVLPAYPLVNIPVSAQINQNFLTMINQPQQIVSQPLSLNGMMSSQGVMNNPNSFQPTIVKPRASTEPYIPDLRQSPQVKTYKTPGTVVSNGGNFALEQSPHMLALGESVGRKLSETSLRLGREDSKGIGLGSGGGFSAGGVGKKSVGDDKVSGQEDNGNGMSYFSILNAMEQAGGEKGIKKNIILTRNNYSNAT